MRNINHIYLYYMYFYNHIWFYTIHTSVKYHGFHSLQDGESLQQKGYAIFLWYFKAPTNITTQKIRIWRKNLLEFLYGRYIPIF